MVARAGRPQTDVERFAHVPPNPHGQHLPAHRNLFADPNPIDRYPSPVGHQDERARNEALVADHEAEPRGLLRGQRVLRERLLHRDREGPEPAPLTLDHPDLAGRDPALLRDALDPLVEQSLRPDDRDRPAAGPARRRDRGRRLAGPGAGPDQAVLAGQHGLDDPLLVRPELPTMRRHHREPGLAPVPDRQERAEHPPDPRHPAPRERQPAGRPADLRFVPPGRLDLGAVRDPAHRCAARHLVGEEPPELRRLGVRQVRPRDPDSVVDQDPDHVTGRMLERNRTPRQPSARRGTSAAVVPHGAAAPSSERSTRDIVPPPARRTSGILRTPPSGRGSFRSLPAREPCSSPFVLLPPGMAPSRKGQGD